MVRVTVSSLDGSQVSQDLDYNSLVSALHQLILHRLDTHLSIENSRLIHISGRALDGEKTLQQESIKEKDELILIKRRLKQASDHSDKENPAPEIPNSLIEEVASYLPESKNGANSGVTEKQPDSTGVAQVLFTRIIATLVETAEMLQYDRLQEGENQQDAMFAADDIKQITECGFTPEQAKSALAANYNNLSNAIEWLLAGNTTASNSVSQPSTSTGRRRRKRGNFQPDPEAVKSLMEMGFGEADVVKALECARNNRQDACNYLLGEKTETSAPNDLHAPLPKDHPLYKIVMERCEIQKALLTPKFLDVMRDLDERRAGVVDFSDDPEISPILYQLSKAIQKYSSHG